MLLVLLLQLFPLISDRQMPPMKDGAWLEKKLIFSGRLKILILLYLANYYHIDPVYSIHWNYHFDFLLCICAHCVHMLQLCNISFHILQKSGYYKIIWNTDSWQAAVCDWMKQNNPLHQDKPSLFIFLVENTEFAQLSCERGTKHRKSAKLPSIFLMILVLIRGQSP